MTNTELTTALRKLSSRMDEVINDLRRIKTSQDIDKAEVFARRAMREAEEIKDDLEAIKRKI